MREQDRHKKTLHLGELLPRVLERIEKKAGGRLPVIAAKWQEIVGEEVARHTVPVQLQNGRLTIEVDDSVWMAELSRFHRGRMIDAVNGAFEKKSISTMSFRPKKSD